MSLSPQPPAGRLPGNLRGILEVYRAQFRITVAQQIQYRAALIIWLLGFIIQPVIYLVVWSTVARSGGGQVGGFTTADFAAYYIVLMLVDHLTFTWIIYEFDFRIREGLLSPLLLRPVHPIHADVADNVTYKLLTLVVMIPATAGLILGFHPRFHLVPWAVAAFVPALVMAFTMRFLVEWTFALVAFWTTRATALNQFYDVAVFFLSGQVAPLSLFPPYLQTVASLLPFRWMVAFPVELFLGRLSSHQAAQGLLIQGIWILIAAGMLGLVWRAGLRQYSAVGS